MKTLFRNVVTALLAFAAPSLQAGNLKVTIAPSQAVSAGAQWRVDGGTWRASGATVKNLSNTAHPVEFKTVSGWIAAPPVSVTLAGNTTTSITGTYVLPASLTVNLNVLATTWRVDGGAWRNGGTTATGLAPGNHTLEYSVLAGFTAPPTETIALVAGQVQTLTRNYTEIPPTVRVNLTPGNGRFRIDSGAWTASGVAATTTPGNHTVTYEPVAGYWTPSYEVVSLVRGETRVLDRSYTPVPATFSVTLASGVGQWRINGGAWQVSAASVSISGGNYLIEYAPLAGYTAPAAETVTLGHGAFVTISRAYVLQSGTLQIFITSPTYNGTWRIDGGTWRGSGSTAVLPPGNHLVEYQDLPGLTEPIPETVSIVVNESTTLNRAYLQKAQCGIGLTPASGKWRVGGGPWYSPGVVAYVDAGTQTVEYLPLAGYDAPPTEQITFSPGAYIVFSRSYTAHPGTVQVTLVPDTARWRIDGGAWQASGATLSVPIGTHTVQFEPLTFFASPPQENFTLAPDEAKILSRSYTAGGDVLITATPKSAMFSGIAEWRVDGGPWQRCGVRTGVATGTHTLEFKPVAGWSVPEPSSIEVTQDTLLELEAAYFMPHRLRFFINQDLTTDLSTAEIQARLSQYAAHLQTIWHRETARRFTFDPETDITICTADPFSWSYIGSDLPNIGFEMWIYARLTDNPAYGTYGGNGGLDVSGAGGAANLKWDRIHDPATLEADTPALRQYWKQLDHITHEFEHSFGAGLGEYYSLATLADPTGVAPILPTVRITYPDPTDPFWGTRQEYWNDPLLMDIYGQQRVGFPNSLPVLLDTVRFAPVTKGLIDGLYRRDYQTTSLPSLSQVKVSVVDAVTGQAIPGATCRAWNRLVGTYNNFEQTVVATATPGVFEFRWEPYPAFVPLNNHDNAKIIKAWAPGYVPKAQWESIYDAQKAKVVEEKEFFEITIALTPQ